jgi:hypothetical protein
VLLCALGCAVTPAFVLVLLVRLLAVFFLRQQNQSKNPATTNQNKTKQHDRMSLEDTVKYGQRTLGEAKPPSANLLRTAENIKKWVARIPEETGVWLSPFSFFACA